MDDRWQISVSPHGVQIHQLPILAPSFLAKCYSKVFAGPAFRRRHCNGRSIMTACSFPSIDLFPPSRTRLLLE